MLPYTRKKDLYLPNGNKNKGKERSKKLIVKHLISVS